MMLTGSEEGWRNASSDSRRHDKQRDIRKLVKRYVEAKEAERASFERQMEDDYYDAALEVAVRMRGDAKIGYSRKYAANWDRVFSKEK